MNDDDFDHSDELRDQQDREREDWERQEIAKQLEPEE